MTETTTPTQDRDATTRPNSKDTNMSITANAYAAIPGYTEEASFRDKLLAWEVPTPASVDDAFESFRAAFRSCVLNDTEAPIEEAKAVLNANQSLEIGKMFDNEKKAGRIDSKQRLENIITEGSEHAFHYLDTELQKLVSKVGPLTIMLAGARTPSDAIAKGDRAIAAWQELTKLADQYHEIRATQKAILTQNRNFQGVYENPAEKLETTALYQDAIDVSSIFTNRRREATRIGHHIHNTPLMRWMVPNQPAGKFDSPTTTPWWPEGDRTQNLILICEETKPWIPDAVTITKAHSAAINATNGIAQEVRSLHAGTIEKRVAYAAAELEMYRHLTEGTPKPQDDRDENGFTKAHHATAKRMRKQLKIHASNAAVDAWHAEQREQSQRGRGL